MVWRQFGAIFTASEYLALFLALLRHFDLAALIASHSIESGVFTSDFIVKIWQGQIE